MILSRLTINSIWLLIARAGTQFGLAFFTVILARFLGSSMFGEYTFIASAVVIGNVLTTFGTDMMLIKEIAVTGNLFDLFPALVIQILFSLLFITFISLFSSQLTNLDSEGVLALRIYSLSLIPLSFFTVFTTYLRGKQRMLEYSFINLVLIIFQIGAVFLLRSDGGGIVDLAILLFLVQVIGTLIAGYLCRFNIQDNSILYFDLKKGVWNLMRICAPIALLGLFGILYQRLSSIMILSLSGSAQTGIYSAAARVVEAAKIGNIAIFTALYPLMAHVNTNDKSSWPRTFRLPFFFLLIAAIVASSILAWLAKPFIYLLFGSEFSSSVSPLQNLSWILIPYTINSFMSLAFLAKGNANIIMVSLIAGIIALVALTISWEPIFSLKGVALAALFAEFLQSVIMISYDLHQRTKILF